MKVDFSYLFQLLFVIFVVIATLSKQRAVAEQVKNLQSSGLSSSVFLLTKQCLNILCYLENCSMFVA